MGLSYKSKVFLLVFHLLPAVLLLWFIFNFSVNVPYWNQWELVNLFEKVATNSTTFNDFFAQHNEHRIVFPKVIFVTLAFASKWNIKYELLFSLVLAITNFILLNRIIFNQVGSNANTLTYISNIIICVLIFSFVQYGNWLWGFQIAWFLTNVCVILAIFFITSPTTWSNSIKLSLAAI